jgi:hypothetical protein
MLLSMTALAQPDTRITEGSAEQGKIAPAIVSSRPPAYIEGQKASLERSFAGKDGVPAVDLEKEIPFKPQLMSREATNDTGLKKLLGIQFPLDPLAGGYYSMLRATGYILQAMFGDAVGFLNNTMRFDSTEAQAPKLSNKMSLGYTKGRGTGKYTPSSPENDNGTKAFLIGESLIFAGLALHYSLRELNSLFENSKLALAAELGKPEEKVTKQDLLNTDNPIISTEVNRLIWKTLVREISAAGFAHRLETGLMLAAVNITAERTVFYQKTAYDMASELVNDVQINHITGDAAKEDLINGLQRIVQRTTLDHNRTPFSESELHLLRPVFADIAEDILTKKIGIASVIGYLGGGMLIAGDLAQSECNYDYVKQHGLAGVAKHGEVLREQLGIEEGQPIWKRYQPAAKVESNDIAESAKERKLLSERYGLDSRASHLGVSASL